MWWLVGAVLLLVFFFRRRWEPPAPIAPMDRARALAGEDLVHAAAGDTNVGRALFTLECSAAEAPATNGSTKPATNGAAGRASDAASPAPVESGSRRADTDPTS